MKGTFPWLVLLNIWTLRQGASAFVTNSISKRSLTVSQASVVDIDDPSSILSVEQTRRLESLVQKRSEARWEGNYTQADLLKEEIQDVKLPNRYQVVVSDIPRNLGGGSQWKIVQVQETKPIMEGQTILQLAHAALGLSVESSSHTKAHSREVKLESIVQQAKERLNHANFTDAELGGRKAADAAFWFALAGVTDVEVFQRLVDVATRELKRFGERSSCRRTDIYQIMERFSAAGVQNAPALEHVARHCLSLKEGTSSSDVPLLDFHSDRSLLLIWKFSTKQKKQRAFLQSALKHWQSHKLTEERVIEKKRDCKYDDWDVMFADPSRPLVVDIGCGMGVSLLGLARGVDQTSAKHLFGDDSYTNWKDYNYVGVDLGGLGICYARSLASRWGITDRLQFVVASAEEFLQHLKTSYPGPIALCLIQFPTPYKLKAPGNAQGIKKIGNTRLPTSAKDGFMVSSDLLALVRDCLSKSNGRLLLQSNCEDVAIHMRDLACNQIGFVAIQIEKETSKAQNDTCTSLPIKVRIPQRTADWIAMGGERAVGTGWCEIPILQRQGATETEVACGLNGTPVHRCLLQASM